jgi:hypothetical protein
VNTDAAERYREGAASGGSGNVANDAGESADPTLASSDIDAPSGAGAPLDGGAGISVDGTSVDGDAETATEQPPATDAGSPAVWTPSIVVFPATSRSTPTNCTEDVEGAGADYCLKNSRCDDNDAVDVSCAPTEGGTWECNCTTLHFVQTFEVSDVTGAAACDAASELCAAGKRPASAEQEACSSELLFSGPTYCELQQECSQSVQLTGGVTAAFTDETTVNCASDGSNTGALSCTCDVFGDGFDRGFRLSDVDGAISGEEACERVLQLCNSEPTAFGGPQTCGIASENTFEDRCDMRRMCVLQSTDDDALGADALEQTSCESSGDGSAQCLCDTTYYSFAFSFQDPGFEVRCIDAADICASAYEIQLDAVPPTCETAVVSTNAEGCSGVVRCGQAGEGAGQALVVYGHINVECAAGEAPWQCSCATPLESIALEMDASRNLADACLDAAETCAHQFEAPVGITTWKPAGSIR